MRKGSLPPGFRFYPTDVELVRYYLRRKVMGKKFHFDAIADVDIYNFNPWELSERSRLRTGDLKWYFFCPREKKYATGDRQKRAAGFGFWKTTGKDRPVSYKDEVVGMIKSLVFHTGKSRKGERTDWVMHEYRLKENGLAESGIMQDAFVLCVIFEKDGAGPKNGAQYGAPFDEDDWADDEDDTNVQGEVSFGDASILLPTSQCSSILTGTSILTTPIVPRSVSNATSPSGHMASACVPSSAVRNASVSRETCQLVNVGEGKHYVCRETFQLVNVGDGNGNVSRETSQLVNVRDEVNGSAAYYPAVVCEHASVLLGDPSGGSFIRSPISRSSEALPSNCRHLPVVSGADAPLSDVSMPLIAVSDAHDLPLVISDGVAPCSDAYVPPPFAFDACPPYVEALQVQLDDDDNMLDMLDGFTYNEVFDYPNPSEADPWNMGLEDLSQGGLVDNGQFLELMDLDDPLNFCAEQDPNLWSGI